MIFTSNFKLSWTWALIASQSSMRNWWNWNAEPPSCPTGFIKVPWNADFNQVWFCVAKYEMTYSNLSTNPSNSWWNTYPYTLSTNIASQAWYPIASITQSWAIDACRSMWSWYHLITNNEWMTIARNIEWVWVNWSWSTPWNWWLFRWISEELTYGCDWNPDLEWGVPSTNVNCTRRVHTLSNWEKIWDFVGNVWEHVDRSNNPNITTAQVWNGNLCNAISYWHVNWDPSTTCQANYWPSLSNTKWWSDKGMWYIRNSTWTDKIFLRWAWAWDSVNSWIFSISLDWIWGSSSSYIGFRCAF